MIITRPFMFCRLSNKDNDNNTAFHVIMKRSKCSNALFRAIKLYICNRPPNIHVYILTYIHAFIQIPIVSATSISLILQKICLEAHVPPWAKIILASCVVFVTKNKNKIFFTDINLVHSHVAFQALIFCYISSRITTMLLRKDPCKMSQRLFDAMISHMTIKFNCRRKDPTEDITNVLAWKWPESRSNPVSEVFISRWSLSFSVLQKLSNHWRLLFPKLNDFPSSASRLQDLHLFLTTSLKRLLVLCLERLSRWNSPKNSCLYTYIFTRYLRKNCTQIRLTENVEMKKH